MVPALWAVLGCSEFLLDPIESDPPPPRQVVVEETFVQDAPPAVDLLFVVDDTASMAQEQALLADDLRGLLALLDDAGVAWQLGVVSTDRAGPHAGWLLGEPFVLTPTTPDRDEAFASLVSVGTTGGGPEAGLACATEALRLARPGAPNAGFRRDDAVLHVLFASDADDESDPWLGEDPVAAFLEELDRQADRYGLPARASAIAGPVPTGCTSARGTAQAGFRYGEVVRATGGVSISICAPDLLPIVDEIVEVSTVWRTVFPLRETPSGDVVVRIDAGVVPPFHVEGADLVFEVAPAPGVVISVEYPVRLAGRGG